MSHHSHNEARRYGDEHVPEDLLHWGTLLSEDGPTGTLPQELMRYKACSSAFWSAFFDVCGFAPVLPAVRASERQRGPLFPA